MGPAGIIILVTGAGGVLKQILVDSGLGTMLAESIAGASIPVIVLAWCSPPWSGSRKAPAPWP